VSDYIDELVREYFPHHGACRPLDGWCHFSCRHDRNTALALARAVAERVKASARLCDAANCRSGKAIDGEGAIYGPCPRCAGRGVTFGGEA